MKTKEEIIKILNKDYYDTKSNLIVSEPEDKEASYNRIINIETETGDKFHIEWWANIGYLHYHGAIIPFTEIYISSTWPNRSLLNIQGSYNSEHTTFIIPIREYVK